MIFKRDTEHNKEFFDAIFPEYNELYKAFASFMHNNNTSKEITTKMIKDLSEKYCKLHYNKKYDAYLTSFQLFLEAMIYSNVKFEKESKDYIKSEYVNDNNENIMIKMLDKYCSLLEK